MIADEDLERETEEKTSSVHFLRFELTPGMVAALRNGVALGLGVDHPNYQAAIPAVGAQTGRRYFWISRKSFVEAPACPVGSTPNPSRAVGTL